MHDDMNTKYFSPGDSESRQLNSLPRSLNLLPRCVWDSRLFEAANPGARPSGGPWPVGLTLCRFERCCPPDSSPQCQSWEPFELVAWTHSLPGYPWSSERETPLSIGYYDLVD